MIDYASEHLKAIARRLDDFDHEGVVLSSDQVIKFKRRLTEIAAAVVILECEVSRHRWNNRARAERELREQLDAALMAPGTNIVPFHPRGRA